MLVFVRTVYIIVVADSLSQTTCLLQHLKVVSALFETSLSSGQPLVSNLHSDCSQLLQFMFSAFKPRLHMSS